MIDYLLFLYNFFFIIYNLSCDNCDKLNGLRIIQMYFQGIF